jgi:non-ribosomal peptide synthetase component F
LAAVQVVVWSRLEEDIITVSAPVGGRTQPELEDLVGCFVHGMLFPTTMTGDPTFIELVGRVRDGLRDALEHQNMPLLEIAKIQEFATVNGMGTQGIALEWSDQDVSAVELPGRSGTVWAGPWWPRRLGQVDMPPADLFVYPHRSPVNRGIDGEFMYNSARFDRPEIESVFEQLR